MSERTRRRCCRLLPAWCVLGLLLLHGPPIFADAQAPPTNIEDAPTPTALHDLLPEAGVDAVDIAFWLIFSTPRDEDGDSRDSLFMYWSVQPIGLGRLRFQHVYGTHPPGDEGPDRAYLYHKQLIYDADGNIVSYHADFDLPGTDRWVIVGRVVGDDFLLTTTLDKGLHLARLNRESRAIPLSRFDTAVPVEWMPLVIAYHLRRGHLGYRLTTIEFATRQVAQTRATDLGIEMVEHEGDRVPAHFIGFELAFDPSHGVSDETIKVLALKNGEYMRMHYQHDELTPVRRATAQQVADAFGVNVYAKREPSRRWGNELKRLIEQGNSNKQVPVVVRRRPSPEQP